MGPQPLLRQQADLNRLVSFRHRMRTTSPNCCPGRLAPMVCSPAALPAASGRAWCCAARPDAVVLDYRLPDGESLEAAEQVLSHAPATRIILLTAHPFHDLLSRAADIGICGLLPAHGTLDSLFDAIKHARPGAMVIHPSFLVPVPEPSGVSLPPLRRRERQVLALLAEGCDARAAAKRLNVTLNTCRGYVKSVLSKLDAHTQLEAVARRMRLLEASQPD
jgi:DNA-binding NarL/FixJ family response regulator